MIFQKLQAKFSQHGAFAKNSAILFAGSLTASLLNYVFHLVIGRQVSVAVYGQAESLISLIAIISVPAATLTMVATKYGAACKADDNSHGSREILTYLNKKVLKFGLPIFLVAVMLTPVIGKFLHVENNLLLIMVWLAMYVSFFNAVNTGLLNGWQKFKEANFASVATTVVKLLFGVGLVALGFALGGIIGSLLISTVAGYGVTLWYLKASLTQKAGLETHCEKTVDFKALRKFVAPVFVGNLAITILGYGDMVLAKHNLSELAAGQYGALTVTSKVIFFATGVIAGVLFSMSAENNHKGNSSHHFLNLALLLVLGASLFATLIYFLFPALVLSVLFGNKYQVVAPYLGWFAIVVTLYCLSNLIFQYLLSIHQTKVSYALLAIAVATLVAFELGGKSITGMLIINIISQTAAIVVGGFFLLGKKGPNV
ncbi:MAG: oligosaccharide flippase family protein [Candidatus Moraniibacteriota bacterium]